MISMGLQCTQEKNNGELCFSSGRQIQFPNHRLREAQDDNVQNQVDTAIGNPECLVIDMGMRYPGLPLSLYRVGCK